MFWVFIVALCILLWGVVTKGANMGSKDAEISYSDLLNQVKQGKVLDAEVQGGELHGHMKATPKVQFHAYVGEHYESLEKAFTDADPTQTRFNKKPEQSNIIPLVLVLRGRPLRRPADERGDRRRHPGDRANAARKLFDVDAGIAGRYGHEGIPSVMRFASTGSCAAKIHRRPHAPREDSSRGA